MDEQNKFLRQNVLVLQSQLQDVQSANSMLCNILFLCPQLAQILCRLLKQPGYCLTLTFAQESGVHSVQLPITHVQIDRDGTELQIFHRASDGNNQLIALCSSWCIELMGPAFSSTSTTTTTESCWSTQEKRPCLARFTTKPLRLQTDHVKQVRLFHAQGKFLGTAMTCPFTLVTRNYDQEINGSRIKRPQGRVFLTSLLLSINFKEHRSQLLNPEETWKSLPSS